MCTHFYPCGDISKKKKEKIGRRVVKAKGLDKGVYNNSSAKLCTKNDVTVKGPQFYNTQAGLVSLKVRWRASSDKAHLTSASVALTTAQVDTKSAGTPAEPQIRRWRDLSTLMHQTRTKTCSTLTAQHHRNDTIGNSHFYRWLTDQIEGK